MAVRVRCDVAGVAYISIYDKAHMKYYSSRLDVHVSVSVGFMRSARAFGAGECKT